MARKRNTESLMSAGGVVYRSNGAGHIEVAICGLRYPESWRLPKGTPDPGETVVQTALRPFDTGQRHAGGRQGLMER